MSVVSNIQHYQRSIEKCQQDESRLLHCINKLYALPVKVQHLQETGVGRTINSLRKSDGEVGEAARALVAKWKRMVEAESDDEPENNGGTEDHEQRRPQESAKHPRANSKVDKHDKKDKHRLDETAGGSRDLDYRDGRKRKKDAEEFHRTEKRRRTESEDEGIDEDANDYDRAMDSDSERLHIEVREALEQRHSEDGLDENPVASEDDGDDMRRRIKEERVSPGEEYNQHSSDGDSQDRSNKFSVTSPVNKLKYGDSGRHSDKLHSNHEKLSKKSRHTSEYSSRSESTDKYKNRSSSQISEKCSSETDGRRSSSTSKYKDKDAGSHSSSSSRSESKLKETYKDSDAVDLRKVKSEPHDSEKYRETEGFDLKKVKLESQKSSSSSKRKDDKPPQSENANKKTSSGKDDGDLEKSSHKDKKKKDKHKDKHHDRDERKSSHREDKRRDKEKRKKVDEEEENGVDSFSGTSFAEALGMCVPEKPKKRSSQPTSGVSSSLPSTSSKVSKSSLISSEKRTSVSVKDLLSSPSELERQCASMPLDSPDNVAEDLALPAINPHYKPLPHPNYFNSPSKKVMTEDEALSNIMYSKVQRTKVFSGNKTGYTTVPSLFDLCTRVLQENIDALEYTGGVPFELLKPVLERANPDQLFTLEDFNAYLIEDTDVLWEFHCKKEFRNKKREEMETWRDMFMRCREEREKKLRDLTTNITLAAKAKSIPVRKTQLAYVEGTAKPPRNIARKQAKFGTANPSSSSSAAAFSSSMKPSTSPGSSGLSSSFTGRSSVTTGPAVVVPPPRGAAGGNPSNSCKPKPKAPLMQKALALIKSTRYKR